MQKTAEPGTKTTEMEDPNAIFFFIPNLIGFARVILAIISFYFMPTSCLIASTCYILSVALDAVDGHAARYYNQSTKFGAILDQLTDRCGTTGLLVTLCQFYPAYSFWFQLSIAIDISCHWIYLHSSLLQGKTSHKFISLGENPLMRIYYTNRTVLFLLCGANEAFYSCLYLLYFTPGPAGIFYTIVKITAPFMLLKTGISLLQGYVACKNIALIDVNDRAKK